MKIFILWLHLPCSFSYFRQPFHFTLHLLHSSNKCSYNSTFWQKDLMAALACICSNLNSPLSYYLDSDISWKKTWKAKDVDVPLPLCSHCLLNVRCCRSWALHRIKHVWSFQVWNVEPMQKCFNLPFIWNGRQGRSPLAPMWLKNCCHSVFSGSQSDAISVPAPRCQPNMVIP